jgi:cell division septation protein DedD
MSQSGPPAPSPGAGASQSGAGARKPDAPKIPLNKRAYTLKLSFSMLLTTAIVALIGISWVFMLGVMVGRGDNPDVKVREFTERVLRGKQAPAVQEPPQAILRPEELNFSVALRDRPLHNGTAAVGTPAAQPQTSQTGGAVQVAPARNGTASQTAQLPAQTVPPGAQSAQSVRFDFVYQVAAFREPEQADKLRERLEGEGVRTSMEKSPAKGGKGLYLVLAVRRGTEEDNGQLLAIFERLKLGAPLLRSKKPVPGGAGGR